MESNQNSLSEDKIDTLARKLADVFRSLFAEFRLQPAVSHPAVHADVMQLPSVAASAEEMVETPPAEESVVRCTEMTESVPAFEEVSKKLQQQTEILESVQKQINKIGEKVQDFTYKDEINSRLNNELQKYKVGLRKEFTSPLLKGIIREYDRTMRQYQYYWGEGQKAEQSELYYDLLKQFDMMGNALLELLEDYDITPFEPKEGDAFNPKEQRILEVIETEEADRNNTVAQCVACGFREFSSERINRYAEVNIYKQKQTL